LQQCHQQTTQRTLWGIGRNCLHQRGFGIQTFGHFGKCEVAFSHCRSLLALSGVRPSSSALYAGCICSNRGARGNYCQASNEALRVFSQYLNNSPKSMAKPWYAAWQREGNSSVLSSWISVAGLFVIRMQSCKRKESTRREFIRQLLHLPPMVGL
jgi:hypothetical protein